MNLEPKRPQKALFLGKGFHKAVEAYYQNNRSQDDAEEKFAEWTNKEMGRISDESNGLWDEEIEELEDQIDLGMAMINQYVRYAEENDDKYFNKIIDREIGFEIDIPNTDHTFVGEIDGLVKDKHDRYWLQEDKTAKSMSRRMNNLELDEQPVSYAWALAQERDIDIEGILFTVVRKKAPTTIKENKTGGLSKRKVVNTYENYRTKLLDYYGSEDEVPWDEYEDVLTYYKQQDNPFVKRERVRKNEAELDDIRRRITQMAKQVEHPKEKDRNFPSPGNHCEDICAFKAPCIAMNRDDDWEFILEQQYQERG
jgi:hypothetical protein